MHTVLACITIAANLGIAVADFAKAPFVVANSSEVGVPASWLPVLGGLKAAGAAGVLLGLLGVPLVGAVAAFGLAVFYVGAVVAHLRARVFRTVVVPLVFLAMPVLLLSG
ncbi:hypothetical protein GCM10022247_68410 [Allokutzneria multivorans]|uniref:DoxX family protein n=1 Tax=Allokutzneria multivorans TaxID=1142134 RepID=A0ABP7U0A3_9PSEU